MKGVIFFFIYEILRRGFLSNSGKSVLKFRFPQYRFNFFWFFFFFYKNPFSKFRKWKKTYSFHSPTFANMKKKFFQINIEEKWTNSRAQNGVVPETMYGMSQCFLPTRKFHFFNFFFLANLPGISLQFFFTSFSLLFSPNLSETIFFFRISVTCLFSKIFLSFFF